MLFMLPGLYSMKRNLPLRMLTWSYLVLAFSCLDLILMFLLAADYDKCPSTGTFCILATGIVMTLAGRGYLLWMLNVTAACLVLYFRKKVSLKFES